MYEYSDKISLNKFRANKKITENKSFTYKNLNNIQESNSSMVTNENGYVKLPKLNIQ